MRLFKLDPRLDAIASLVPPGAKLYDVGTDHARLPVYLLCTGKIETAVASDIAAGPLDAARRTASRFGVEQRIRFVLCDGLPDAAAQDAESECVVIAGMGGETIAGILDRAAWLRSSDVLLILQPMTKRELLLEYLSGGFTVEREIEVTDGRRKYAVYAVHGKERGERK